jgi:PhzF family phenazine biosynthesis protein
VVGFVNGTCVVEPVITEESMSLHRPEGRYLVIHSVTVHSKFRRKGLGTQMLKDYIANVATYEEIDCLFLLCKANLLSFYVQCGFSLIGLSPVVHGQEPWFDMQLDLSEARVMHQSVVDAFANGPFTGNPAAVVFDTRDKDEAWMRCVAAENNLAETAFLSPIKGTDGDCYNLRWFTPTTEVDLCGHATLASAHALYESKRVAATQTIKFHTLRSGILTAQKMVDGSIQLDFPVTPVTSTEESSSEGKREREIVERAFGIDQSDILSTGHSVYDTLVEVTPTAFCAITDVQYDVIKEFAGRGLILTCLGGQFSKLGGDSSNDNAPLSHDARFSFLSRFFGPLCGINEDPVTGSAHCALAPYWFQRIQAIIDPVDTVDQLCGYQASKRGGVVDVRMVHDRVLLSGPCVTTIQSKLLV